jgi:propionate catabolism operon transcriptional regulator
MSADAERKPIVWAFSVSRLRGIFESVAPRFADAAEIHVFDKGFEDAIQTERELLRGGERVDVFIAAGANGAYLRDRAQVPVAFVTGTASDVLRALTEARKLSRRVGIVSHGSPLGGVVEFAALHELDLEQRAYETPEEAREAIGDLAARGIEVIVGSGQVCDLADRAGLRSVFLFSTDSVRDAIERALSIAGAIRAQEARRDRLANVLSHVEEAIAAVDMEERIEWVNPALERVLGVTALDVLGKKLSAVSPDLSLARVLETGCAELEEVQKLGNRTLVVNRSPVRTHGVQTGAVITCQDSRTILRMDRGIRSQHRPRRFVARYQLGAIIGASPAMERVRGLADRYSRTDATVLVTGETGTGKEVVAQGIHNASTRRDRPFVAMNCAAFPETLLESELFGYEEGAFTGSRRGGRPGLFEAAHTGTIFLDEVGDVPLSLQTRLLRVLQERQVIRLGSNDPTPVDVRVIAATNRDLRRAVADGDFRADLYYRLNILPLHLPPLRERMDDVELLAADLLHRALLRIGAAGLQARLLALLAPHLRRYAWPGNVRELENVIERVAVFYADRDTAARMRDEELELILPELSAGAAPPDAPAPSAPSAPSAAPAPAPPSFRASRDAHDKDVIRRVLEECGGNQTEAARRLGIGRSTLWRKLMG